MFSFQGLRKIRISQKLHKLCAKWGYNGWTCFHLILSGTNTQCVIDTLKSSFGDPSTDLEDKDLDIPSLKCKCTEAAFAETADASLKWEYDPSKETKFIKVVDNCTPVDYGIEPDLVPKVTDVIVVSPNGEESTKVFYQCKVCPHRGQNWMSMMNHAQKCLNIKLQCFLCSYSADSAKLVNSHVKNHKGHHHLLSEYHQNSQEHQQC